VGGSLGAGRGGREVARKAVCLVVCCVFLFGAGWLSRKPSVISSLRFKTPFDSTSEAQGLFRMHVILWLSIVVKFILRDPYLSIY